jgi:hypothetical protein
MQAPTASNGITAWMLSREQPTIPGFEQAKTVRALDRMATVIGLKQVINWK